jgi:hypothetical protein
MSLYSGCIYSLTECAFVARYHQHVSFPSLLLIYHVKAELERGAMCNFASDSTGFSRGFPGVHPHLLTLTSNFTIPFYREILLFMGVCSVSKRSCERILRKGKGSAITIVVGGAAESLSAHPGTADLTLRRRCVLFVQYVSIDWWMSS